MQIERDNIFSENKLKLENLGKDFLLSDFKKIDIHSSLKKYVLAEIDYQLFNDIFHLQQRSKFDYKSKNIEKYFSLIFQEIKNNKEFNITYISELLRKAVEFNSNFLSQPNRTLLNFIFEDNKFKTKSEIFSKLQYVYYYRYLCRIILSYLEKKQIQKLNRKEFTFLLTKIDEISKKNNTQKLLDAAINSMINYFNQTGETSPKIPYMAIKSFLEEKKLIDFLQSLQLNYEFQRPKYLSAKEIRGLFELDFSAKSDSSNLISNYQDTINNVEENQFDNIAENNEENTITISFDVEEENLEKSETEITETTESNKEDLESSIAETEEENLVKKNIKEVRLEQTGEQSDEHKTDEKIDINNLIRELIDVELIYNSLFKQPTAFASNDFFKDMSLNKLLDFVEYKYDKSTLSEDFIAEIPEEEEYISVFEEETVSDDLGDNIDQNGSVEKEVPDNIEFRTETEINLEQPQIDNQLPQENILDDDNPVNNTLDINDTIDDIVLDKFKEQEFQSNNEEVGIDPIDNDEVQEMTNLIDDDKLKLIEDEEGEVTEVFTDLTFLDKEEIENNPPDKIQTEIQDDISPEDEDIDYETRIHDSETDVKVVYTTFNEMLFQKEMTNIIETIFDYDMEDYHKIIRSISNSSSEKEGIEITDSYCRNNHVDTFHEDVIKFKSYISDYFAQSH